MRRTALLLGLLLSGCGGSASVAGSYSITVTNGDNGCAFDRWPDGMSTPDVPFRITQEGDRVTGEVGGLLGLYLSAIVGDYRFLGRVSGSALDLTLFGSAQMSLGACAYTINGRALATVSGDVLEGTIDYSPATNGHPDCGSKGRCKSTQHLLGARSAAP